MKEQGQKRRQDWRQHGTLPGFLLLFMVAASLSHPSPAHAIRQPVETLRGKLQEEAQEQALSAVFSDRQKARSQLLEIQPTAGAAWVARHGLTAAQYQEQFNYWAGLGYRLTWVSGYSSGSTAYYAALWEVARGPAWVARHGLTADQYQTEFTTQARAGYRLVLVNGYGVNNVVYYAAIWQKLTSVPWVGRHGLTAAQYQTEFNTWVGLGYRLEHISGYSVNNVAYYAAIFVKSSGPAWQARHGMTAAQYQAQYNTYNSQGYALVDVSGYGVGGVDYYAAIWEQSSGFVAPLIARHAQSAAQYQANVDDLRHQGYRPVLVVGYAVNGIPSYASIWKNYVYTGLALNALDMPTTNLLASSGVPSLSVAVTRGGKLVYAKAYGYAIKPTWFSSGVAATTASRYRIMSVSKSVTAATIERMTELGLLSLDDYVFGPGSILGTNYGSTFWPNVQSIRVRHLMSHSAGGWGRSTPLTNIAPTGVYCNEPMIYTPVGTSITDIITSVIKNCPLDKDYGVTRTPGKVYDYSNFGYAVLGRVIEAKAGWLTYEQYVRTNMFSRMGITDIVLAQSTLAQRQANEVQYYASGGSSWPYNFNVPRMDAHGGWLASAISLARYASYVDGNTPVADVFASNSTWIDMVTPAKLPQFPNYAKGWINDRTSPNRIWHDGSLDGTSSVLVQTSDGLTLAALCNSRDNIDTTALLNLLTAIKNSGVSWSPIDLL